jgi:hypothetical protein
MPLDFIFGDSFDKAPSSLLTTLWTEITPSSFGTVTIGPTGRFASNGARFSGGGSGNFHPGLYKTLPGNYSRITVGYAYRPLELPGAGTQKYILNFADVGNTQCSICLRSDGTLGVFRGPTLLGATSFSMGVGNYYYLEVDVQIGSTAPIALRIDGVPSLSITANTQTTANPSVNQIGFGKAKDIVDAPMGGGDHPLFDIDDVVVGYNSDGSGGFFGDLRGWAIFPSAPGAYNQFTLFDQSGSSTQNWQTVKEHSPDSDSSYNFSSVVGNKDMFSFDDIIGGSGSIVAVVGSLFARKDDSGGRTVSVGYRSGSTDFFGPALACDNTYRYLQQIWRQNPITTLPWAWVEINPAQFGYRIES